MDSNSFSEFSTKVRDALHASFTDLIATHSDRTYYAFAVWTDDSLQFIKVAANTEEGLASTVDRYKREVDPEYGSTSTLNGMRWSYGDWEFFPVNSGQYLSEINGVLQDNFNAEESVFQEQIGPLWKSLLEGFQQLDSEGFFGTDETRSRVTLLFVGDLNEEMTNLCVSALNPPDVAESYIDWDPDAPDGEREG